MEKPRRHQFYQVIKDHKRRVEYTDIFLSPYVIHYDDEHLSVKNEEPKSGYEERLGRP